MSVLRGDCVEVMAGMDPDSVDAIVTDPPYGLEFMGKDWDRLDGTLKKPGIGERPTAWPSFGDDFAGYNPTCETCGGRARGKRKCPCAEPAWKVRGQSLRDLATPKAGNLGGFATGDKPSFERVLKHLPQMQRWHQEWAAAALRVAKPGAYLLAFGGTRTVHRMTTALEDAGWVIRDMLVWAYAQGFPKSKASLKPAWEPIVMARKPGPLRDLNIDAARIGETVETWPATRSYGSGTDYSFTNTSAPVKRAQSTGDAPPGRWPANVVLTATEWYTLRDDVAQSVADTIRGYFTSQGVGDLDVPDLREGVRGDARVGARRTQEILLAPVQLEGVAGGQAGGSEALPGGAGADEPQPDRQGVGVGLARMEGRTLPRSERLRPGERLDAAGAGAGDGAADVDEGQRVRPGAPAGGGDEDRAPADAARGGASPQRGEGRQPAGEPVRQGPAEPHAGASSHRPGTGATARAGRGAGGRERRLTVPLDLIPSGWLHLFEHSHDTGIFDGGWDGVVGGGDVKGSRPIERPDGFVRFTGSDYNGGREYVTGDYTSPGYGDTGTYSRFFLVPKAPTRERVLSDGRRSPHPTQKPEALIRHLVKLVTPDGGLVLDPFLGSGTLGVVCDGLGVRWLGIEREAEYADWAEDRIRDGHPAWDVA